MKIFIWGGGRGGGEGLGGQVGSRVGWGQDGSERRIEVLS